MVVIKSGSMLKQEAVDGAIEEMVFTWSDVRVDCAGSSPTVRALVRRLSWVVEARFVISHCARPVAGKVLASLSSISLIYYSIGYPENVGGQVPFGGRRIAPSADDESAF